ncbi:MAG: tetratricopeptide repeat protein [Nitrospira sp.]|nr:tetratricopeptide repeat protein [Nitrospira sp.]
MTIYDADAHHDAGNIFQEKGQLEEAIIHYQKALRLNPNNADIYFNLGNVLRIRGEPDKAIESYNHALAINPHHTDALLNKGFIFQMQGNFEKAIECYKQLLQINPRSIEALNNLGNLLKDIGQLNDAEMCFRRVIETDPNFPVPYSNLLFLMNYNSRFDAKSIFSEHLNFARIFAEPITSTFSYIDKRRRNSRLKIGYVSPDFRQHSVSYFIVPVLETHNREQFELFCYATVPIQDDVTRRIQNHIDQWQTIAGMSDKQAAELINKDEIDILIDLAGHTSQNHILLFAHKPAPIQVTWLGYPATTGIAIMDYKIVDHYTDPPGMTEQFYSEELVRMPEGFLCYLPDKDSPEIVHLPALSAGHITFGSFNNFAKVTPEIIAFWTDILKAIPGSRMIIKSKGISDEMITDYIIDMFIQKGITADRIELLSWELSIRSHLETYNRIDIGLDTFPYNGTTTTCEALWMGVPVITLSGNTHASRVGMSLLSNIGLPELVAGTPDEYVKIAVDLARDLNRLQSLRERLRDMMAYSPLMNKTRFIMNLENCYRTMWEKWCKST